MLFTPAHTKTEIVSLSEVRRTRAMTCQLKSCQTHSGGLPAQVSITQYTLLTTVKLYLFTSPQSNLYSIGIFPTSLELMM